MQYPINLRRAALLGAVITLAAIPACTEENNPLGAAGEQLAEECGLTCPSQGIVEGNASISGVAKVDAFFGSVVKFSATANAVANNIEAELAKIRASLGLEADADAAAIVAEIKAKYRLEGDLVVRAAPPKCAVSAQATVEAQARCEGQVTPPQVNVDCKGSCEIEASGSVECSGMLECTGTAPNLECEGTCRGSCKLEVAAECTGTCRGTCNGTCSVEDDEGNCAGSCDGECQGTCELEAGGSCSGQCKGECTYTPPEAECHGTARCTAMGSASVECKGRCEGEVTPPSASAECEASAKADASFDAQCTPPSLDVSYQFAANANAQTRAEFEAFLVRFKASFGAILAELERSEVVLAAAADLADTGADAVHAAVSASLEGDLSLKAQIGLTCALTELDDVAGVVESATTKLQGRIKVAGELSSELLKG